MVGWLFSEAVPMAVSGILVNPTVTAPHHHTAGELLVSEEVGRDLRRRTMGHGWHAMVQSS